MSTTVELSRDDQVSRITFHSESGIHLLTASVRQQLSKLLDEVQADDGCRVVVFQAGGRTFLAGADVNEMRTLNYGSAEQFSREGQKLLNRVANLRPVTLAALQAACVGGGCELAFACDIRMSAAGATIGLPEVSLGIVPGWGGTVRACRLFGGAVARRIILAGRLFDADEALDLGIVDAVVSDDEFRKAVEARIAQLLSCGPTASRGAKRLIAEFEGQEFDHQLMAEALAFARCFGSGEAAEGLTAFLEKHEAEWRRAH